MNNAHLLDVKTFGTPLNEANEAIIMIHGRGSDAKELVHSLRDHLKLDGFAILAPQATNNTWYPHSFLAPPYQNEPWLSSALEVVHAATQMVVEENILEKNIYFLGFSQGACLLP